MRYSRAQLKQLEDRAMALVVLAKVAGDDQQVGPSFESVYGAAMQCDDHDPNLFTEEELPDVKTVLSGENDEGGWAESDSWAIGLTPDGRFAVVEEWSDSTGHG